MCHGNSQVSMLQLMHGMGQGAAPWSALRLETSSKTERFAKLYLHVMFKKPVPQFALFQNNL